MLPSRLFRNTGIPPSLRSLITPGANLPSTISVQLRFRLGVQPGSLKAASITATQNQTATFFTSTRQNNQGDKEGGSPSPRPPETGSSSSAGNVDTVSPGETSKPTSMRVEPKMALTMTCTVSGCGERSTHEFTKQAYEKGIVLIQCPKCKNRHLIADHLGWFKDITQDGKHRTLEDIMKSKGEKVTRGQTSATGSIEFTE